MQVRWPAAPATVHASLSGPVRWPARRRMRRGSSGHPCRPSSRSSVRGALRPGALAAVLRRARGRAGGGRKLAAWRAWSIVAGRDERAPSRAARIARGQLLRPQAVQRSAVRTWGSSAASADRRPRSSARPGRRGLAPRPTTATAPSADLSGAPLSPLRLPGRGRAARHPLSPQRLRRRRRRFARRRRPRRLRPGFACAAGFRTTARCGGLAFAIRACSRAPSLLVGRRQSPTTRPARHRSRRRRRRRRKSKPARKRWLLDQRGGRPLRRSKRGCISQISRMSAASLPRRRCRRYARRRRRRPACCSAGNGASPLARIGAGAPTSCHSMHASMKLGATARPSPTRRSVSASAAGRAARGRRGAAPRRAPRRAPGRRPGAGLLAQLRRCSSAWPVCSNDHLVRGARRRHVVNSAAISGWRAGLHSISKPSLAGETHHADDAHRVLAVAGEPGRRSCAARFASASAMPSW